MITLRQGDCQDVLPTLPAESVHCCVTSPPYFGLRDYGVAGQIGLEPTPDAYVATLVEVFRAVRRVLRQDGTLWLNLGDSYASGPPGKCVGDAMAKSGLTSRGSGRKAAAATTRQSLTDLPSRDFGDLASKQLLGIPWRVAFALQADGWYLRSDIIWAKPNPMPESVTDRPTKAHEYLFLLAKSERYYYDAAAIAEPSVDLNGSASRYKYAFTGRPGLIMPDGKEQHAPKGMREFNEMRNRRSVWTVATSPYSDAHFATFPPALIEPCILAGCPPGGTVLDPFGGAGTTGLVADRLQRNAVLIELNPAYSGMAERRIIDDGPLFAAVLADRP